MILLKTTNKWGLITTKSHLIWDLCCSWKSQAADCKKKKMIFKIPPFSAKFFEAQYAEAGRHLLPISWTSFIALEFQSCSLNTVGFDNGRDITASVEDVITIRCTWDLNNNQYKLRQSHTRVSMRFWAYRVSPERQGWWALPHRMLNIWRSITYHSEIFAHLRVPWDWD